MIGVMGCDTIFDIPLFRCISNKFKIGVRPLL